MSDPFSEILSCPLCGHRQAVPTIVIRQIRIPVAEKCRKCDKESELAEWRIRKVGHLR